MLASLMPTLATRAYLAAAFYNGGRHNRFSAYAPADWKRAQPELQIWESCSWHTTLLLFTAIVYVHRQAPVDTAHDDIVNETVLAVVHMHSQSPQQTSLGGMAPPSRRDSRVRELAFRHCRLPMRYGDTILHEGDDTKDWRLSW